MLVRYLFIALAVATTTMMLYHAQTSSSRLVSGLPSLGKPNITYNAEANTVVVDGIKEWRVHVESSMSVRLSKWIVSTITLGRGRLVYRFYDSFERLGDRPQNALTSILPSPHNEHDIQVIHSWVKPGHSLKAASISGEISWLDAAYTTSSSGPIDAYHFDFDGERESYTNWFGGYVATAAEIVTYLVFKICILPLLLAICVTSIW